MKDTAQNSPEQKAESEYAKARAEMLRANPKLAVMAALPMQLVGLGKALPHLGLCPESQSSEYAKTHFGVCATATETVFAEKCFADGYKQGAAGMFHAIVECFLHDRQTKEGMLAEDRFYHLEDIHQTLRKVANRVVGTETIQRLGELLDEESL